mgnify:CR=1 FL=1|tara:strand:- start:25441 stop:25695 length:255 start_codon:yes stop_codon:yes gene_type:complete
MKVILLTVGLAVAFLGIGFAGLAVKILFKKNGKFGGTCASNSPFLNKDGAPCAFCGATPEDQCKNEDEKEARRIEVEEFSPFVN